MFESNLHRSFGICQTSDNRLDNQSACPFSLLVSLDNNRIRKECVFAISIVTKCQRDLSIYLSILMKAGWLVGWFVVIFLAYQLFSCHLMPNQVILIKELCFNLVLWHIRHYRLFNAKSIFIHINSSI